MLGLVCAHGLDTIWFPIADTNDVLGYCFAIDAASRFSQVLGGMIPIDDLMAGIEVFTDQVPDPDGAVANSQTIFNIHPGTLSGICPELASKHFRSTQMGYISVVDRTA